MVKGCKFHRAWTLSGVSGVGGSSVFVLLSLVNKETTLSLLIGQNLGRWGKLNGMLGERRAES